MREAGQDIVKLSDLKKNGIPAGYDLQGSKLVPRDKHTASHYGYELFDKTPIHPAVPGAEIIEVDLEK